MIPSNTTKRSIITIALSSLLLVAALAVPATAATYDIDTNHSSAIFKIKHLDVAYFYGAFKTVKGTDMVREVFADPKRAQELLGNVGIAHVRYPTAGGSGLDDVQPFYANFPCGLALALVQLQSQSTRHRTTKQVKRKEPETVIPTGLRKNRNTQQRAPQTQSFYIGP